MLLSAPPLSAGDCSNARTASTPVQHVAAVLRELPTLGCVLCQVHAPRLSTAPSRWSAATGGAWPVPDHPWLHGLAATLDVQVMAGIDSDGPCEHLVFAGLDGRPWMRVWLLPDSDYCAWDHLLQRHALQVTCPAARQGGGWWAAWCRRYGAVRHWRAAPARFALRRVGGFSLLGLGHAQPSPTSRRRAEHLAGMLSPCDA